MHCGHVRKKKLFYIRFILGYSALFCWRFCKSKLSYEYTCIYNFQSYLKQDVFDVNLSNYCKFIVLTASLFKKKTLNCQYSDVRKTFSLKYCTCVCNLTWKKPMCLHIEKNYQLLKSLYLQNANLTILRDKSIRQFCSTKNIEMSCNMKKKINIIYF